MEDLNSSKVRIVTSIDMTTANIDGSEATIGRLNESSVNAM